ncbi:toxin-antitoxin system, antitoxin component, ribbon-helix-helix domain protein [Escherichia coli 1.2741]|nr:toxin-antitoxin system, antitoxin component, ribbon-helix-helix domain protein [Escherichia coli 1.2741]
MRQGRQQLERGDVLSHNMVESSAAAWRDEIATKVITVHLPDGPQTGTLPGLDYQTGYFI